MSDDSIPQALRANAELVVRTFRDDLGVELGFNRAGVEWVDGYINRMHASLGADHLPGLIRMLASFVGECIIQTHGGRWVEQDGSWGVQVSEWIWASPFAKIEKQFENGPADSVASFVNAIPVLDRYMGGQSTGPAAGA